MNMGLDMNMGQDMDINIAALNPNLTKLSGLKNLLFFFIKVFIVIILNLYY